MAADRAETRSAAPAHVRVRPLIQPAEHGVYGLFAEPVLLGLILAPSLAGVLLALAGAAAVLAQQPAALGLADLRRGRRYPRTDLALRIAAVGGTAALVSLVLAAAAAARSPWWAPLGLALLPAALQLVLDRAHRGRTALAQGSGAVALAGLAPAIALAGGAPPQLAWSAWLWLLLRIGASIPEVRARLRRSRGRDAALAPARLGATALAIGAGIGWAAGLLTWLPVVVATAIAARSFWSLRPGAAAVHPARVGIAEIFVGLLWVATLAVGIVR